MDENASPFCKNTPHARPSGSPSLLEFITGCGNINNWQMKPLHAASGHFRFQLGNAKEFDLMILD
jgi:hypothetical protein